MTQRHLTRLEYVIMKKVEIAEKEQALYCTPESAGWVELLQELMDASAPYLQRKKMTPRHECNALNEVWAKCAKKLDQHNRGIDGNFPPMTNKA